MRKIQKIFILVLMLCSYQNLVTAQSFNVTWGDKARLNVSFDDAVQIEGGKSIVLKSKTTGGGMFSSAKVATTLMIVDANTTTVAEKDFEPEEKNTTVKGFEKYGKNIFLLYEVYEKSDKLTSLYAEKIDQKNLKTLEKIKLGSFESDSKSDQASIELKLSQDSSKVLVLVEAPERKKENRKFYFTVLNTDLKKIWSKEVELPYTQKYIYLVGNSISDDGKVYVSIKNYDKEVSRESVRENGSKVPSYVYKILIYSQASTKEKEILLNMDNNFVHQSNLSFNKSSGLVTIAGLYKQKVNGQVNGVFYASIDAKTDVINTPKLVPFDEDIIFRVSKDGFASKKEKDPGLDRYYEIVSVMRRPNGSIDIISEYRDEYVIWRSRGGAGGTGVTITSSYPEYHYQYGTIVNTNIDKSGKAIFTRIPKNQKYVSAYSPFSLFLSFYPILYKENLVLLFNDDKDNVDRDIDKKPDDIMKFKNSVLAAATIDTKGILTRQAVFSNDEEDYIALPKKFSKIDDNTLLVVSDLLKIFKKRTRYGVMKMK